MSFVYVFSPNAVATIGHLDFAMDFNISYWMYYLVFGFHPCLQYKNNSGFKDGEFKKQNKYIIGVREFI